MPTFLGSAGMWIREGGEFWKKRSSKVSAAHLGYWSYKASLSSHETLHTTTAAAIRSGTRGGDTGSRGIDYNVLICKT